MQHIEIYENGYGVSVVNNGHGADKGLLELAVIHRTGPDDAVMCFSTPVAKGVIGYLDLEAAAQVARALRQLDPDPRCTHARTLVVHVTAAETEELVVALDPGWHDADMITADAVCSLVQAELGDLHAVTPEEKTPGLLVDTDRISGAARILEWSEVNLLVDG